MEIIADSARILCDPWFVPGAFDGSWWQWPPLKTQPEELTEYTHLYISHIHQDHCDPYTLRRLPNKDVPVIILKRPEQFLKRCIQSCGFHNFIELEDRHTCPLGLWSTTITMYGAFTPNAFIENAEVPNIIDTSIVVSNRTSTVFNANDNVPTAKACQEIVERHGPIDVALLPYSGVGPYPSSYENLSYEQKLKAAKEKKHKYLQRLRQNALVLQPKIVVPCAGQMILGGRQMHKNKVIGIPSPQTAYQTLKQAGFSAALLNEGDTLDTETLAVQRSKFSHRVTKTALRSMQRARYWWEDAFGVPKEEMIELLPLLQTARNRLWQHQERYNYKSDWWVGIRVEEVPAWTYAFSLSDNSKVFKEKTEGFLQSEKKLLRATVPYGYLTAILTRHCHWNNAYHGCHIEWYRKPDDYHPEIQTLLSFFHL